MIPVAQPIIAKNAKKYVSECLTSGWVSSQGEYVAKFEDAFARFIGVKYAVATSSGTSALHLALAALNIGKGDEVIIPALTMIAAALPVIYQGATPVLVDSEPDTGNIDVTKIEEKITKRTRVIIAVHLHGHPVDMEPLLKLAKKYRLAVVEDAAEAHGAGIRIKNNESRSMKQGWVKVGSLGDIGCFSFYGNKIITTGEGGMAVTNHKKLAERMRSLQNLARTPGKHFLHQEIGFTYRMSALQAALGLAQLEEVNRFIEKKREIAALYNKLLSQSEGLITLPLEKAYARSIHWQYGILLNKESKLHRDKLAKYLAKRDIETRTFFVPLHEQPAFEKLGFFRGEKYPVAEDLSTRGICLPSGLAISKKDIHFVARMLKAILSQA